MLRFLTSLGAFLSVFQAVLAQNEIQLAGGSIEYIMLAGYPGNAGFFFDTGANSETSVSSIALFSSTVNTTGGLPGDGISLDFQSTNNSLALLVNGGNWILDANNTNSKCPSCVFANTVKTFKNGQSWSINDLGGFTATIYNKFLNGWLDVRALTDASDPNVVGFQPFVNTQKSNGNTPLPGQTWTFTTKLPPTTASVELVDTPVTVTVKTTITRCSNQKRAAEPTPIPINQVNYQKAVEPTPTPNDQEVRRQIVTTDKVTLSGSQTTVTKTSTVTVSSCNSSSSQSQSSSALFGSSSTITSGTTGATGATSASSKPATVTTAPLASATSNLAAGKVGGDKTNYFKWGFLMVAVRAIL